MMQRQRGFTLIELAVTVAIVGILATVAFPMAELSIKRQRESELRSSLREIRNALDAYHDAAMSGRIERGVGDAGYPKQLEDLVNGMPDKTKPGGGKIYFLRRLPRDPNYVDQSAQPSSSWGKRAYATPPDAPAEGEDIFDVYSLSMDTGLNGIPYREW